jgi:hypothetical protein
VEVSVFSMKTVFLFLAVGFVALWTSAVHADLVLTYDSPTLQLAPGQSIEIGATLANTSDSSVLTTDSGGVQAVAEGFTSTFTVGLQGQLFFIVEGGPASPYLAQHSHFVVSVPNPMADLNIAAGSFSHLTLGTLTIDPTAPAGLYTGPYGIDVGIYEVLSFPCPGVCFTNLDLFAPPTIDAGILAVTVSTVPESATLALLGIAAAGMGFSKRRKSNRQEQTYRRGISHSIQCRRSAYWPSTTLAPGFPTNALPPLPGPSSIFLVGGGGTRDYSELGRIRMSFATTEVGLLPLLRILGKSSIL